MPCSSLIHRYAAPVPRYTSYPTAPHFAPEVDAARYARWLESLPPATELSLYLHVPFCDTLCWFCGCHTRIVRRHEPVAAYLDALIMEAALVADWLRHRRPVRHIHFGGGSPTLLMPGEMRRLMGELRDRFDVASDAEIAIEIDPRGFGAEAAAALGEAGFTRASLGVQDLDPEVQRAVNRIQPYAVTARTVEALRAAGVRRINLDLMYGLPHQTAKGVAATVAQVLEMAPDRVALFGYAHVPWLKRHQRMIDEAALPGPVARFEQARAAAAVFQAAGYRPVGLDHFARPDDPLALAARAGALQRNFQGYTTDGAAALIGLGPSAIGQLPDGYVQNATGMGLYRRALRDGRLPTARGIALTCEDRLHRAAIAWIMCAMELDVAALCRKFGRKEDALDDALERLAPMARDGVVRLDGRYLSVPEEARLFVRSVASAFDAYLERGAARHSVAV